MAIVLVIDTNGMVNVRADGRRLEAGGAEYRPVEHAPPAPGYFGTFAPNAYDYGPTGYGSTPPYGYGFPPYGYGCLQRTVVLTLFGPRVRSVWMCG